MDIVGTVIGFVFCVVKSANRGGNCETEHIKIEEAILYHLASQPTNE